MAGDPDPQGQFYAAMRIRASIDSNENREDSKLLNVGTFSNVIHSQRMLLGKETLRRKKHIG